MQLLAEARTMWAQLQAPIEGARTRVLIARALQQLGDDETATIELEAATRTFGKVSATRDLARLGSSAPSTALHNAFTKLDLPNRSAATAMRTNTGWCRRHEHAPPQELARAPAGRPLGASCLR